MIKCLKNLSSSQASFISVPASGFRNGFLELAHPFCYKAVLKRTFEDRRSMGEHFHETFLGGLDRPFERL
jgi:hypothetical protein